MARYKKPEEIRVGVLGYGGAFNMGRNHLRECQRAGMTPVAVADLDPERLKVAEEEFPGIATFTSLKDMLKKSGANLIILITPHNLHAKQALECVKAGCHVVCEKPLAITTAECDAMIDVAKKNKVVLSTYHNRHWDGCIMRAVKEIKKGVIGDVFRIEAHMGGYSAPRDWWRGSKTISGGIQYDWGVHLLEYSLQLLDGDISEVSGFAKTGFWSGMSKWKADSNEDEGYAVVRFSNGKWLTLCNTTLDSNPKRGQLEITGTKGSYVFDGGTWEVIQHKKGEVVRRQGKNPASEGWRLYQNIADHLVKGENLVITGEWARRPIHILDLADRSAKEGKSMKAKHK
ncbi:Gfo/Idh/MocA family oxidoreductase [bacterium]|nr:Gfo/Idh/MocA family oxidoreductase [bacterium]